MATSVGQRIFLSHAHVDKPFVNRLIARLRECGVGDPWYDTFEIDASTESIADSLRAGIAGADWFALVLSPASASSHWVTYEVQAAQHARAKTLILLHASPHGLTGYLANPHLNDLLRGGQHKVLDFSRDYERGLSDLLLVVAPGIGEDRDTQLTLAQIIDDEDPDVAERAMTHAALSPERFLPLLLERLPDLRNDRKTRLRVEAALSAIGSPAIDPLLDYVSLVRRPEDSTKLVPPAVSPTHAGEDGTKFYTGKGFTDLMRYMILSGGNRSWSAQLGAKYALVALAQRDRAHRRKITEDLQIQLENYTSIIASEATTGEVSSDFIDVLRIAIETLGLAAEPGEVNDFLVYQFATTELWDWQSALIKDKLGSYVVECLMRSGSAQALDYLVTMLADEEILDEYFRISRSNPFEEAFARFGFRAVDRLLKLRVSADPDALSVVHLNLARIAHPRAAHAAIEWAAKTEPSELSGLKIVAAVAATGLSDGCDELLERYSEGAFGRFTRAAFADDFSTAAVVAARHATNASKARAMCAQLIGEESVQVRMALAQTIPAIGAHELYQPVIDWLDDAVWEVRTASAVSLCEHHVLKEPTKLLRELQYAEPDKAAPMLGVALSYFGEEAAVEALAHGLRYSLRHYDDGSHEMYAAALDRIGSDAARLARTAWYRRI